MFKQAINYICSNCGAEFPRWQGKCDKCGEWNTLVETIISKKKNKLQSKKQELKSIKSQSLNNISIDNFKRISTGIFEFDRVLGGGIVLGEVVLIAGEPGIGKSTLILQIANTIALTNSSKKILYISGEESLQQIKIRAERLGMRANNLELLSETNIETIIELIKSEKPILVIIDSIQTLYSEEIESASGGIAQVQLCGQKIISVAKENNIPILIVGHVTKEGTVAGPRVLEHMVDAVLYLEGDRYHTYRLLRGVKNRFGATDEIGVFEMSEQGMLEIKNPSEILLQERLKDSSGSVVTVTMEGTRPILLEIQALTNRSIYGLPKRTSLGIDFNRIQLLGAILAKRLKLSLDKQDIYISVVGGFKINEPASDLAVALAIISAYKNKPIDPFLACFGELGLAGEIRSVTHAQKRVYEAEKLGFKKIILPLWGNKDIKAKIKLYLVKTLKEALEILNFN